MKKLFTFFFCSLVIATSWAQWHHDCGTHTTPEQMQEFYNRDKSHLLNPAKALVKLPVVYHIIGQDDGSGYFKLDDLLDLHCSLNEDFAPADVEFLITEIRYINDDYYFNFSDDNAGNSLMNVHNVSNHCNVFLTPNAKSGSTPVCGYSFTGGGGPNQGGIVLDNSCSLQGSSTFTHEMGHYLNLNHTFYGWEGTDEPDGNSPAPATLGGGWWSTDVELVARTNCQQAGDGFCGTQPDYISDRWTCDGNGESQIFQDPNGVEFRIDGKNYMSYSNDACTEYFSSDQQAEVNAAASIYRPYLLTVPLDEYSNVQGPTSIVYPEDEAQFLSYDNVSLQWDEVVGAEMYHVQVATTNFDINMVYEELVMGTSVNLNSLLADEDYVWRVKPINYRYTCAAYTSVHEFSTSSLTGTVSTTPPNCPGETNGGMVSYNNVQAGDSYSWSSPDSQLDLIVSAYSTSSINSLSVGFYSVEITNGGQVLSIPFQISGVEDIEVTFASSSNSITANITGGTPPYNTIAWSSGANGTVNSNPVDGNNTLSVFDSNGCAKSFNVDFEANNGGGVAINEIETALENVLIYPNPVKENSFNLDINLEKANKTANVSIYAITGQQVFANQFDLVKGKNSVKVETGDLTQGVYFVKTSIDNYQYTQRLVVLK